MGNRSENNKKPPAPSRETDRHSYSDEGMSYGRKDSSNDSFEKKDNQPSITQHFDTPPPPEDKK